MPDANKPKPKEPKKLRPNWDDYKDIVEKVGQSAQFLSKVPPVIGVSALGVAFFWTYRYCVSQGAWAAWGAVVALALLLVMLIYAKRWHGP